MRHAHVAGFLVLSVAFALAACGGDDDDDLQSSSSSGAPNDAGLVDVQVPGNEAGASSSSGDAAPPPPPGPRTGTLDRAGRPWVSLLLVTADNRDAYNATPVELALPVDDLAETDFGADFQSALVTLDQRDGTDDWAGGAADAPPAEGLYPHPLATSWITADALLVDPNEPFATNGYLDIEQNEDAHETCGGRWFNDDTLDVTMSYLVSKQRSGVTDGVNAPAKPAATTFPYLQAPF